MIEQLLSGLKGQIGTELQQKAGISSNMVDDVLKITGSVAGKEVGKEMLGGNLDAVMNLFSDKKNNSAANSLQNNITSGIVGNLITKLGLKKETANLITSIVVPLVMNMITQKNNETPENDASPLESIFEAALNSGGKKKSGLGGLLGGLGSLLGK